MVGFILIDSRHDTYFYPPPDQAFYEYKYKYNFKNYFYSC